MDIICEIRTDILKELDGKFLIARENVSFSMSITQEERIHLGALNITFCPDMIILA